MLKLVYGKSGSGKSTYLYEDIKNKITKEKIFLIVPEQSNLKAEQKLFEYLKVNSILNVQVLTLSRLAVRIFDEIGGNDAITIKNSSKSMVIYDILANEKEKLNFLGKSDKNIELISNMITELKKHNITLDILEDSNIKDNLTNLKIKDIELIYQKYQEKLSGNFIDENDILTLVSSKIQYSTLFENSEVYIDDFLGFTPQEYNVFENILKMADNVTVAVSTNNLDVGRIDEDIFYFNKIFANKLIEIAENNGLKNYVSQATIEHLTGEKLKQLSIIVPPFSLQQSFATKIEAIEKQKAAISKSIEETQKLFDYTIDKYFG